MHHRSSPSLSSMTTTATKEYTYKPQATGVEIVRIPNDKDLEQREAAIIERLDRQLGSSSCAHDNDENDDDKVKKDKTKKKADDDDGTHMKGFHDCPESGEDEFNESASSLPFSSLLLNDEENIENDSGVCHVDQDETPPLTRRPRRSHSISECTGHMEHCFSSLCSLHNDSVASFVIHEHEEEDEKSDGFKQLSRLNSMDSYFHPKSRSAKRRSSAKKTTTAAPNEEWPNQQPQEDKRNTSSSRRRRNSFTRKMSFKGFASSPSLSFSEGNNEMDKSNSSRTSSNSTTTSTTPKHLKISMKGRPTLQRSMSLSSSTFALTKSKYSAKIKRRSSEGSKFIEKENEAAEEQMLLERQRLQRALDRWKKGRCNRIVIVEED